MSVTRDDGPSWEIIQLPVGGSWTILDHRGLVLLDVREDGSLHGAPAPAGSPGPTGAQGATGPSGPQGEQGPAGLQGNPGATGSSGPQGQAGATGPQGPAGQQGPAGAQGLKGDTGETGAAGPQGQTGSQGAPGAAGAQGIQGPPGNTGPAGSQGSQGIQGLTGNAGSQGVQGIQGPAGPAAVHATLANGATAMALGTNTSVKVTPTGNATYTTTVPPAGTRCAVIILTSGASSFTITFGAGFKPTGTLATGTTTARVFVVHFISDGTNLYEAGRTAAMVA